MPGPAVSPLDLAASITIPWHFRCPISLELMSDPVTLATGQTYDRTSIESWIATGNFTCPVTRTPLLDFSFTPNHTLRRLIQDWCVSHRSLGVQRIPTPKQPVDPSLVQHLLSDSRDRITSLRRLRALARESDKNRTVISTSQTKSTLIDIAFEDSVEHGIEFEAFALLSMFTFSEAESISISSRPDRLLHLSGILTSDGATEARVNAAAVIEAVAVGSRSAEVVGAVDGVLEGLVQLVEEGSVRGVRVGIRGLFSLCLAKENRRRAVAAGAAEAVVRRINERGGDAERALATVELLCRCEGGREAVVAGAGGGAAAVNLLVRAMTGKASDRATEHAAGALVAVVGNAEALQREAVAAGVVPQLLMMVQGGCSDRAKRKAQLLLKLLRSAWPHHYSVANSDDFLQPF